FMWPLGIELAEPSPQLVSGSRVGAPRPRRSPLHPLTSMRQRKTCVAMLQPEPVRQRKFGMRRTTQKRLRWSVGHDPPRMGVMARPDMPVGGPPRQVGQPHPLNVAPRLALKPAARLNPIEIAVDLQHAVSGSVWMTGSTRTIPLR